VIYPIESAVALSICSLSRVYGMLPPLADAVEV
jgi:hypothetical protein